VEPSCFKPFGVREIGLYADAGKHFLRIEVQRQDRGARIRESLLARPFHYGDEVQFAGTRGLLQYEVLEETRLRLEERVNPALRWEQ
jgi:hypothetical protein